MCIQKQKCFVSYHLCIFHKLKKHIWYFILQPMARWGVSACIIPQKSTAGGSRQKLPSLTKLRCSGGSLDKISDMKCSSCIYTSKVQVNTTTHYSLAGFSVESCCFLLWITKRSPVLLLYFHHELLVKLFLLSVSCIHSPPPYSFSDLIFFH